MVAKLWRIYLQADGMKGQAKDALNLLEFFHELDDNQSPNALSAREIQGWLQYEEHSDYRRHLVNGTTNFIK